MLIQTQFSIFLINKPGVLAQTLNALAENKINIIAMTMMDSVEHGVLRLVTAQTTQTRDVFKKLGVPVNETEVLCVNISNQAGAFADVAGRLAAAHVNINYAYCTAGARGGRTTGVLKVADLKKALKVLKNAGPMLSKKAKTTKTVRRNRGKKS
ncbi:MAG: ACT domain-containing protein [Sedimentisphaerales bacterium]|nr:ACT domain-containing protein [Sedimentisphaerales bacterium]